MLWGSLLMSISLLGLGATTFYQYQYGEIAMIGVFIFAFEISSGPVTWVYLAEMLQDKAYSIATAIIQIIAMIISAVLPFVTYALKDDHAKYGFIWIACGAMTSLGTLFLYVYMKETKGLSL